ATAWVERMALSRLNLSRYSLTAADDDRLQNQLERIAYLPLRLCDTALLTAAEVAREAREMARALGGLDCVIIDHLGYLRHVGERGESLSARIGHTTKALTRLAKDMGVAVLLLH